MKTKAPHQREPVGGKDLLAYARAETPCSDRLSGEKAPLRLGFKLSASAPH